MPTQTEMQIFVSNILNFHKVFINRSKTNPPVHNTGLVSCKLLHEKLTYIRKLSIFGIVYCKPPTAAARKPSPRTLAAII